MYRPQPPPRVDTTTTSKLPRDPSDWVDEELVSYVKSHYSASESLSAVELIRGKRLTPRTLWYLQTDHDALAELTSEESLHQFVLALAQSIHPAVSPTTPRVKHIRRLSEDFAHPPPPPTPPPPSPSLPEESELEEDDDVAESVISDWALDGDNDEIHEAREAPPADATRAEDTREPADAQHAEPTTGESSLGLDIGGELTQSSEPVEPPPQPALSTTSTEESLIDFEDAPETTSRASPEPSVDAATGAQPPEVDTARHGSADPQVTEEPAAVLLAEPEGASLSVNVPDATEEPPSDTSNRDDPPLADEGASAGAGPDGMPRMLSFDEDLGDPWARHSESEAQVESPATVETAAPEANRDGERTDDEVEAAGEHEPLHSGDPNPPTFPPTSADPTKPAEVEVPTPALLADENKSETGRALDGDQEEPEASRAHSDSPTTQAALVKDPSISPSPAAEAAAGTTQKPENLDRSAETDERPPSPDSVEPVIDGQQDAPETPQDDSSAASQPQATVQPGDNRTPTAEDGSTTQQEAFIPRTPSPTPVHTEKLPEQAREIVSGQGDGARASDGQLSEARGSEYIEEHKKPKIVLSAAHDAGQVDHDAQSLPVTPSVEDPSSPQSKGDAELSKEARKKAKKERQAAEKAEKGRLAAEAQARAKAEAAASAAEEARVAAERKAQREAAQVASGGASGKKGKSGGRQRQRQKTDGKTETEAEHTVVEVGGGASGVDASGKDDADPAGRGAETTAHASENRESQVQPSSDRPGHTAGSPAKDRKEVNDGHVKPSPQPGPPTQDPPLSEATHSVSTPDPPASPTVMLANGDEMLVVVKDAGGADTEETPPFVFNSAIGGPPTHSAPQSLTHSAPLDVQSAKLHETPDRPRSSPLPAHEPQAGLRVNTAFPALYEQRRVRDSSSAHQTHTASPSTPRSSGLAFGSSNLAKSRRGGLFSSFSAVTNYASSFLGDSGGSSRNSSQEREAPKTLSSMRSLPTSVRSVERQQSPVARFGDIAHAHVPDPEPLPVSPSPSATVRPPSFKEATTETPTAPTDSPETGERTVADGISEAMGGSCLVSHEGSADAQQASGAQTQRADRAQGFDNESRDIVKTDLDSVAAGEQGVHGVTEVAGDASAEHDRDQEEDENEPLSNWVQVIKDRNAAIAARSDEGSDAEDSGVEKLPSSPRRNKKPHLPIRVHQLAGSDGDQSSPSTPTTTDAYENESNDPDNSTTSTTVSPGHSRRQRRKGGQKKSPNA